jgi:HK97 family phage major capsid protein
MSSIQIGAPRFELDPSYGFDTPRAFLEAVIDAERGLVDERLMPLRAVQGSDEQGAYSDPAGGFLVPRGFASFELRRAVVDPTSSRTQPIPMTTGEVQVPARVDANHSTSVAAGISVARNPETVDIPVSRLEMEAITLRATTLAALTFASERVVTDSRPALAAVLERGFADATGGTMLRERLRGSGAGEPLGVMHAPARILVAKESGQPSDTIVFGNVMGMAERCYGFDQAIWLANHDTRRELTAVVQIVGTAVVPRYVPSTREGEPDRLLGRPAFYTEFLPTLGDEGDLVLCNWGEYLDGLRMRETTESIHVRFLAVERAFRFIVRGDGAPWWRSVLTPETGANTLSPYVVLGAR